MTAVSLPLLWFSQARQVPVGMSRVVTVDGATAEIPGFDGAAGLLFGVDLSRVSGVTPELTLQVETRPTGGDEWASLGDPVVVSGIGRHVVELDAPADRVRVSYSVSGTGPRFFVRLCSLVPLHGAGGFAVGSSYLIANTATQAGLASTFDVNGQFTLASSAGADIEVDGGDNTKINILTGGWYSLLVHAKVTADAGSLTHVEATLSSVNIGPLRDLDFTGSVTFWNVPIAVPAVALQAGDVISFNVGAACGGDTWSWGGDSGALRIVRLS